MTSLDNFRRMIEHRDPAWIPFELPVTPPVAKRILARTGGTNVNEAVGADFRYVGIGHSGDESRWRTAFEELGFSVPANAEIDSQGITHTAPDPASVGEATHFRTMLHPLETVTNVEQLKSLPWPASLSSTAVGPVRARADVHHAYGKVVSGWCECTLFEHAWYLRGMDNLFMDLIEGNGIAEWLLDHFTQRSVEVCRAYVEAGVDVVELGDDVGTQRGMMMSVDDWRTHLRPRLVRVIDAIRDAQTDRPVAIRYHSDGNICPIIDDLIEIGVDILNPVQPECMPADEIISQYKDRMGFWGLVGTQTTMPFGTPEDVRRVVAECVRHAEDGAAIVIAPTHVIEPDVPDENIFALVDAVHAAQLVPAAK